MPEDQSRAPPAGPNRLSTSPRPAPGRAPSLRPDPGPSLGPNPEPKLPRCQGPNPRPRPSSNQVPLQECSVFFPKFASIAAYVRQRGGCIFCQSTVTLSGAYYFDVIPWRDDYWRRVYTTSRRAAAAFSSLQQTMARAAGAACAPPGAKRRRGRLAARSTLAGPPELLAFVKEHYSALSGRVPSLAQQIQWAARFRACTDSPMSTRLFITHVWGAMRCPSRAGQARQT